MKLAPIVLFVYNRPYQTKEVLSSLSACDYARESDLYIFADAAKKEAAVPNVQEVRKTVNDSQWKNLFKTVNVIEAENNKGLAKSVISGVTQVIGEHGRVIVVEDDNRVAPDFLDYMNRALDFYENNPKIGFIGAYKAPIKIPDDYNHDVFTMGRGSSYSWATWKSTWDLVDWEVKDYPQFKKDKKARKLFDEYGEDRSQMLDAQMSGKIDSWAIRFSYSMFKNNKYAILPTKTRVENIGFDGSGVHNVAADKRFAVTIEKDLKPAKFENLEVDERIKRAYVSKFKIPFKIKLKRFVRGIIGKKGAKH
ncbi:MAG: glycosyltransferase [Clostridia bacterium]|nr:glycosyltransferase [Clostridia bacterium]